MYTFDHYPDENEIREVVKDHEQYDDYVRVRFSDGSTKIYYNSKPYLAHYNGTIIVEFCNPVLSKEGAFGELGIIRSKRVVKEKEKTK